MTNEKLIPYFGYGTNVDPEMLGTITGRVPESQPAILRGFELCIQAWDQIPERVKNILSQSWKDEENFRTYTIRKAPGKQVDGLLYFITPIEREMVAEWEIEPIWYEPAIVKVQAVDGKIVEAETQYIKENNRNFTRATDVYKGQALPVYLNPKSRMRDVANKVREAYLQGKRDV